MEGAEKASAVTAVVRNWKQEVTETGSTAEKKMADSIVPRLDLPGSVRITTFDHQSLLLVPIHLEHSNGVQKYLAFSEADGTIKAEGLYQAKDLGTIKAFFASKKLGRNDAIMIYKIDGKLLKGWATTGDGKLLRMETQTRKSMIENSTGAKTASTKNDYVQDPGSNCIYTYLVEFVEETGEIISISLLYTVCDQDGGGGVGEPPASPCVDPGISLEEALQAVKKAGDHVGIRQVSLTSDTAKFKYEWIAAIAQSMGSTWEVHSFETGVHYNHPNIGWQWVSLSHNDLAVTTHPSFLVKFTARLIVGSEIPTVQQHTAGMSLQLHVTASFICEGSPVSSSKVITTGTSWPVWER